MEEVSRRPRTRSMQCSNMQVPTGMFLPLFLGLSLCLSLFVSVSLSLHNECKHGLTQAANNAVNDPITCCPCYWNCDQRAGCERSIERCTRSKLCWQRQRHYGGSVNKTNNEVHGIQQHASANSFVARVIVVDHYSPFSSKECLRDRHVLAFR
ncbi:hypothetical protein Cgig2_030082 [Carnegiea gigantea]|uniref:Uncharacterized protein n=1 Tax=Carnegiea gigantea TaxID=171969 RepID=A0A9Q1JKT2_9CARY|nr:hypothetical protein Cgig2_030082 [Carnegiea gigantea]